MSPADPPLPLSLGTHLSAPLADATDIVLPDAAGAARAMRAALRQAGLPAEIITIAFAAVVGAIAVGVAVAVGVGGRHVAGRLLEWRPVRQDERGTMWAAISDGRVFYLQDEHWIGVLPRAGRNEATTLWPRPGGGMYAVFDSR